MIVTKKDRLPQLFIERNSKNEGERHDLLSALPRIHD